MSNLAVEVWFVIMNLTLVVVSGVLWRLRQIEPPLALCLILICASGILGPIGTLLSLPRGPDSVVDLARVIALIGAVSALVWSTWTTRTKA